MRRGSRRFPLARHRACPSRSIKNEAGQVRSSGRDTLSFLLGRMYVSIKEIMCATADLKFRPFATFGVIFVPHATPPSPRLFRARVR